MTGHRSGVHALAFSPDGKTLASAAEDETLKLWDLATAEELLTLDGFSGPVWVLRFSPDGSALVAIGSKAPNEPGEIRVWLAPGAAPAD